MAGLGSPADGSQGSLEECQLRGTLRPEPLQLPGQIDLQAGCSDDQVREYETTI